MIWHIFAISFFFFFSNVELPDKTQADQLHLNSRYIMIYFCYHKKFVNLLSLENLNWLL